VKKAAQVTLAKWKDAIRLEKKYNALCQKWMLDKGNLGRIHREKHPLSQDAIKACFDLYDSGKPLCCSEGRKNLKEIKGIDECWLEFIHEGAYEYLGCSVEYQPEGKRFADGRVTLAKILVGKYR
jgi:hypothetical protein